MIETGLFKVDSIMFFANAAAVSTINVTKPHMYQPNIKVMFNRVNQH